METLWFCLIGFMLATYVVLDGFDLGAGVLHLFVARTEKERELVLRAELSAGDRVDAVSLDLEELVRALWPDRGSFACHRSFPPPALPGSGFWRSAVSPLSPLSSGAPASVNQRRFYDRCR